MMTHWGEFKDNHSCQDDWGLSFSDLEELLFPHPPSPSPPPPLFQPSQEETASFQILPPEMCRSDPTVLQTIRLLQHQRQLLQLITRAQTFGLDINAAPPPFPDELPVERKAAKHHYLNFLPPSETPFTVGVKKPQKLEIEASTARLILRKAVATVCAHTGYTDTTESVLKVLTDVTHDFLTKFTSVLRAHTDSMLQTGNCPFHDVVEQTLHTMRMGGMAELHKMYKDKVINYHTRVRQRTLQLHHQYQNLLVHAGSSLPSQIQSIKRESTSESQTQADELQMAVATSSNLVTQTSLSGGITFSTSDASAPSVKSNSSFDPEGSLHSYSIHIQCSYQNISASFKSEGLSCCGSILSIVSRFKLPQP